MKVRVHTRPGCAEHRRAGIDFTSDPSEHEVDDATLAILRTDDALMVEVVGSGSPARLPPPPPAGDDEHEHEHETGRRSRRK